MPSKCLQSTSTSNPNVENVAGRILWKTLLFLWSGRIQRSFGFERTTPRMNCGSKYIMEGNIRQTSMTSRFCHCGMCCSDSGHVVTRFKGDTLIGTTRIPVDFLSLCVVCTDVLQCRSVPDIEMWSCKLSALHLQAMDPSTDKDGHHIPHSAGDLSAVPGLDPDPQHGATRDHRERKSPRYQQAHLFLDMCVCVF